ncbi:MAG TPA: formyltransferase family protein [Vicinamibacterales bacterium]|nr:formyltransferase family protein [Vicinamibacterales bacterium]
MSWVKNSKSAARVVLDGRLWKRSHAALALRFWHARERRLFDDDVHLTAAAAWLARAQDSTNDGGFAGRYSLKTGWTSSYPETTGYLVPTLLSLRTALNDDSWRDRAKRAIQFLLKVQLPSGAFPGMEIAQNKTEPSIFNTGQIICGLRAWMLETGDSAVESAARRAADWVVSQQDADGAWRRFLYLDSMPYTYMTHGACWIAELGQTLGNDAYIESGARHLRWALGHVDQDTGWIDGCGFYPEDHAARRGMTHTIAYTIWGTLLLARITGDREGLAAARHAAFAIARRLELSRWLPGMLDSQWRGQAPYACLTGNAQMALIWFALNEIEPDATLISAACKALDLIKRAQQLDVANTGIRGGVPGSDPIWGEYLRLALPNWAPKFFIDALLAKRAALSALRVPLQTVATAQSLPRLPGRSAGPPPRVVVLAGERSHKVAQFVSALEARGWKPDAVLITSEPEAPAVQRALAVVRQRGIGSLLGGVLRRSGLGLPVGAAPDNGHTDGASPRHSHLPIIRTGSRESAETLDALRAVMPDLLVLAGVGIVRRPILNTARIATLNAHMGILPGARGMNVGEWSRLLGLPMGCTVHVVDEGVDTGPILATVGVDVRCARDIASLRHLLDEAQVKLLADVLDQVRVMGGLPVLERQGEGRQFFTMHPALRSVLEDGMRTQAS